MPRAQAGGPGLAGRAVIAAIVRRRRVLLAGAAVLGIAGGSSLVLGVVSAALVVFFHVLGLVAMARRRPAVHTATLSEKS